MSGPASLGGMTARSPAAGARAAGKSAWVSEFASHGGWAAGKSAWVRRGAYDVTVGSPAHWWRPPGWAAGKIA
eukprot:320977-Chlamydomonas_euryale.AAC.1